MREGGEKLFGAGEREERGEGKIERVREAKIPRPHLASSSPLFLHLAKPKAKASIPPPFPFSPPRP